MSGKHTDERLFIIMDSNEHVLDEELTPILASKGIEPEEISHNFWRKRPPNSFANGKDPIDVGYKTSDLEM